MEPLAPLPTARYSLAAVTGPDGRIYAISGHNGNYLTTVEAYTPAPALVAVSTTVSPTEGATFNGAVAAFTDSDGNTQTSAYTTTISWGDGSTSAGTVTATGSTFTVSGNHVYPKHSSYTLSVTIRDSGGSTATAQTTLGEQGD